MWTAAAQARLANRFLGPAVRSSRTCGSTIRQTKYSPKTDLMAKSLLADRLRRGMDVTGRDQDLEPEMTAEWFPAWMLLYKSGLAQWIAPPTGTSAPEAAFDALLTLTAGDGEDTDARRRLARTPTRAGVCSNFIRGCWRVFSPGGDPRYHTVSRSAAVDRRCRDASKRRISSIEVQPIFFIDEHNAAGQFLAPTPKNQVDVSVARAQGVTSDAHAGEAGGDQTVSESLRRGHSSGKHVVAPCRAIDLRLSDGMGRPFGRVERIENRVHIRLVCTQNQRLHAPPDGADLAYGGRQRK